MLSEKTFDAGAVSVNYAEGPRSGPPLVLLHGVTSRWQAFLTMMPVLAQRWHVVAADLRGHGRSGRCLPPKRPGRCRSSPTAWWPPSRRPATRSRTTRAWSRYGSPRP